MFAEMFTLRALKWHAISPTIYLGASHNEKAKSNGEAT